VYNHRPILTGTGQIFEGREATLRNMQYFGELTRQNSIYTRDGPKFGYIPFITLTLKPK